MDRTRAVLFLLAVCVGLAIIAGLYCVLLAVNGVQGFVGCTGTTAFGWIVPLLTGGVIAGISWYLLQKGPTEPDDYPELRRARCPSCGSAVIDEWRLCPECGGRLGAGRESAPRG